MKWLKAKVEATQAKNKNKNKSKKRIKFLSGKTNYCRIKEEIKQLIKGS